MADKAIAPRFQWRHQYDDARDAIEREATDITCLDESLTLQSPAGDADINILMKRMGVPDGAVLPATLGITDPSAYGDFTDMPDLRSALDRIHNAEDLFQQLPAAIKNRFDNDPWRLHAWVNNPDNLDEAVKIGLLQRAEPITTQPPQEASPNA